MIRSIDDQIKSAFGINYICYRKYLFSIKSIGDDLISFTGTDGKSSGEIIIRYVQCFSLDE